MHDDAPRPDSPALAMQRRYVRALAEANMGPGGWDKKFTRSMVEHMRDPEAKLLSPSQWSSVCRLVWKYRKQLSAGIMHKEPPKGGLPLPRELSTVERAAADGRKVTTVIRNGWRETRIED